MIGLGSVWDRFGERCVTLLRVHWVDSDDTLRTWCERLRSHERIAIDTEANSMFVYNERICLVQVSTPQDDLLIDPLAVDLAPLGPVLSDPSVQKVLHGADYDVLSFKRGLGFSVVNLFDTMIAARVLGWPRCGLAHLLAEHFDHAANKAFQRYDWGQRPLDDKALEYARYDTHFLLELSALQQAELEKDRERLELFERACVRQCAVQPRPRTFDPDRYWKFKGARELDEPGRAVLKAVFAWRESKAEQLDRPPFRVLPEVAMMGLAKTLPSDARALGQIRGMPKPVLRRDGKHLLSLVAEHADRPCPKPVRTVTPQQREFATRVDALKGWRKAEAGRRGVEPEIILDKSSLMSVAEHGVDVLERWEAERYGEGIAAVLQATQAERRPPS